jgi:D-3-phosphoglycerate dehydrogenase
MDSSRPIILVAEPFDTAAIDKLHAVGEVRVLSSCDEASLLAAVADCDALVVRTAAEVTRDVIGRASRLKVIGRGGVGLDNIEVDAARERGIAVVYTPAASTDAVADLTLGFLIALVRDFRGNDTEVRACRFTEARRRALASDLDRLALGIIGLGRIGKAVARRARVFGMTVVYHDIVSPGWLDFVARPVSLDELLTGSDVVTPHVPLTDATRRMIDAAALSRMKPTAYLINTSRGAVVDNLALAQALWAGRLAGAALDVFDPEPLPPDHPLLTAPNALFTPHLGAKTRASQARMSAVVDDVIRVLRGHSPTDPAET